ncbi:MAG: hypothetical protein J6N32_02315 [Clostridia bacterium]|nr:hypothetical protein [Clostridia bacterium]MBP3292561.1 hypothetical protein [Clostridia bacterium]
MGAFFTIIFMGFVGTMIDLIFFEMTSDFGIIMAIAAMCPMILNRIGGDDPDDEPTGYGQDEEEAESSDLYEEELTTDDSEQDESDDDNNTD